MRSAEQSSGGVFLRVKGRIEDGTEFLCESICVCVYVKHVHGCVSRERVGRV